MAKRIDTTAEANRLLLAEIRAAEKRLAAGHRATGRDEAAIRVASQRDAHKFIQRRMN